MSLCKFEGKPMNEDTPIPIITIIFGEVELYLPQTSHAVTLARQLLNVFETTFQSQSTKQLGGETSLKTEKQPHKKLGTPDTFMSSDTTIKVATKAEPLIQMKDNLNSTAISNDSPMISGNTSVGIGDIKAPPPIASEATKKELEVHRINASSNLAGATLPFVLKECSAINRDSSTMYAHGKMLWYISKSNIAIQISREGYGVPVDLLIVDLKYLYDNPKVAKDIIRKFGKDTYSNKAVVLRALLHEVPFENLNPIQPIAETQNSEDGSCDDVTFDSCANNKPENCKHCTDKSRFDDKKKLAAKKPPPPLMKATINP